jgi:hypothetical protein
MVYLFWPYIIIFSLLGGRNKSPLNSTWLICWGTYDSSQASILSQDCPAFILLFWEQFFVIYSLCPLLLVP